MPRKTTRFAPVVATANDLRSGRVVFLTARGDWSARFDAAIVAATPEAAASLLLAARADEAACRVVEPALVDVGGAATAPASLRERIRAFGPTAGLPGNARTST